MKPNMMEEAYDSSGAVVLARDAQKGVTYFCRHCRVPMYRNISAHGTPFYATMPGNVHTAPECEMISLETESSKARYALEKTNPAALLKSLLKEPGQSSGQTCSANTASIPVPEGLVPRELRPFRTLAELYDAGVCAMDPSTRMGNGQVADCCCCADPLIANAIDDPFFRGPKIFRAGVDDISGAELDRLSDLIAEGKYRIAFSLFSRHQATAYRRKYVVLECTTEDLLQTIIEALYVRSIDDTGRINYKARCDRVLVAGDWRRGQCSDCPHTCSRQSRSDCRGVLLAPYVSPKQIFGIIKIEDPQDDSRKMEAQEQDNSINGAGENADVDEL